MTGLKGQWGTLNSVAKQSFLEEVAFELFIHSANYWATTGTVLGIFSSANSASTSAFFDRSVSLLKWLPIWFVKCLYGIFPFLWWVGGRKAAQTASPWNSEVKVIQQFQGKPEWHSRHFLKISVMDPTHQFCSNSWEFPLSFYQPG